MHQFHELIEGRLSAGESPILIAAPMPLDIAVIENRLEDRRIAGIVAGTAPAPVTSKHRARVGYWSTPDYSRWELPAKQTDELVFLGAARHVSLAMLLAARKHGVRVVRTVAPGGGSLEKHRIDRMIANRLRTALTY